MKRILSFILAVVTVAGMLVTGSTALTPYITYTYSIDGDILKSPDAYVPDAVIDSDVMGLSKHPLEDVRDVDVDDRGNVYIVDMRETEKDRIVVLDRYYKYKTEISVFNNEHGVPDTFNNPGGVFVTDDFLYVCDSSNSRIVIFKINTIADLEKEKAEAEEAITETEPAEAEPAEAELAEAEPAEAEPAETESAETEPAETEPAETEPEVEYSQELKDDAIFSYTYYKTVQEPKSPLFDSGDIYTPVAVAVDSYGRMFIASSTTNQGIIVMDEDGNFFGFIGAQAASVSALELLRRKFMSAEQIAQSEQFVPTEYNNVEIDEGDFVYATISSIDEGDLKSVILNRDKSTRYAPVKKFNANGNDVMNRNGFYPPAGEVDVDTKWGASAIIDAAVGPNGTWTIIDGKKIDEDTGETLSKVYTYNDNGELLFAFGSGAGSQVGNVKRITAVAYQGDNIIILDNYADQRGLVVFKRTEYGDTLMQAIVDQQNMNFSDADKNWHEILKRNNNFDLAYIGIGKYLNWAGEYDEAMEMFKAAHDTALYSDSFNQIRNKWMNEWFWVIPVGIVVGLLALSKFLEHAGKINKRAVLKPGRKSFKEELYYILHLVFHPFDGFWDLKHERRGSVRAGVVILIFTIIAFFYQSIGTGYIFTGTDATYDTIFSSILSVLVPFGLWVVSNWCLTTLLEGEGSFKDVFVSTSYAIAPLGLFIFISTVCSNFMIAGEATILSLLNTVAFAWAALLLFFGTMITHGYSFGKNVVTVLLTIVAMAFLMFLAVLFGSLIGKVVSFITGIITEINYRI